MAEDTNMDSGVPIRAAKKRPPLIAAHKAVVKLSPLVGGPREARLLLIDEWRSGELRAYARYQWETKGRELDASWDAGPPEDAESMVRVRASILRNSPQLAVDAEKWKWRSGRFFLTQRPLHARRRILFQNVRFVLSEIDELVTSLHPKKGAGGRPTETEGWTKFWMEVVRMALAGELTATAQGDRTQFRYSLIHRLGWDDTKRFPKPPLAADTLTTPVGKIWDTFVEPKAPDS